MNRTVQFAGRRKFQAALLVIFALSAVALPGQRSSSSTTQQQQVPNNFPQTRSSGMPSVYDRNEPSDEPFKQQMEAQRARMAKSDRLKRLQTDTEKLLVLSTELKAHMDKTTKDEMSLDVIRKAAEIEKLAHDVKERMKG